MIDLTNPPVSKRQKTLSPLIEKKSQERMYVELAALDRFSFFSIAKSQFIRRAMSNDGFNCHVSKDYDEAEAELKARLKKELEEGKLYSLSFDEYTGRNRRYMTVNLHSNNGVWYNLRLVTVWKSQSAETLLQLVKQRISHFNIVLEDHIVTSKLFRSYHFLIFLIYDNE